MTQYFVKHWIGKDVVIHDFYTLKDMWTFLQTLNDKKISIYEAECVLDWS